MNIKRTDTDALNATITLQVEKADYQHQVENILANHRKTANIPGFRKGHVPASLIRKKYRTPILVDEINKMIQQELNEYSKTDKKYAQMLDRTVIPRDIIDLIPNDASTPATTNPPV